MATDLHDAFVCAVCQSGKTFDLLAPQTGCQCLICNSCLTQYAARHWQGQVSKLQALTPDSSAGQPCLSSAAQRWKSPHVSKSILFGSSATGRTFSKGEAVLYLTKDGPYVAATVSAVDASVIPPAYTITFDADPTTFRDTDGPRLRPTATPQDKHLDSQGSTCPAPCCQSIITAGQLQV